jgi:hypothetical protein
MPTPQTRIPIFICNVLRNLILQATLLSQNYNVYKQKTFAFRCFNKYALCSILLSCQESAIWVGTLHHPTVTTRNRTACSLSILPATIEASFCTLGQWFLLLVHRSPTCLPLWISHPLTDVCTSRQSVNMRLPRCLLQHWKEAIITFGSITGLCVRCSKVL